MPWGFLVMPNLKNSKRVSYKATHVAVVPDVNNKDARVAVKVTRAAMKSSFIRALRIDKAELPALREKLRELTKMASQADLRAGFRAVESLVTDTSPVATFRQAPKFGRISPDTLGTIGDVLVSTRKATRDAIAKELDSIKSHYSTFLQGDVAKNKIPTITVSDTRRISKAGTAKGQTADEGNGAGLSKIAVPLLDLPPAARQIVASLRTPVAGAVAHAERLPSPVSLNDAVQWAANTQPSSLRSLRSLHASSALRDKIYTASDYANIITDLNKYIGQTVASVEAFKEYLPVEPVGRLHLERIEMHPVGIERGELVHSVPMTPQEEVNISHKEWSATSDSFENIVSDELEGYSEKGVTEKTDVSQASESQSKHATALNVGASLSASYASVTLSSSFGYNATSDDQKSQKDSRNHTSDITERAGSRTRKEHKFSFKVSSVAGTEDQAVRILRNPSVNAIRVDYYQLMRKWKVDLIRYGLRMTYDIVIPSPGASLTQKVLELRKVNAQLDEPLRFGVTPEEINRDNWIDLASEWSATIEPPPPDTEKVDLPKSFQSADPDKAQYDSIVLPIDTNYVIESALFIAGYQPLHSNQNPDDLTDSNNSFFDIIGEPPGPSIGWGGYASHLENSVGRSGAVTIAFAFARIINGFAKVIINLKLKPEAFSAWQVKAWNSMREAAEQQDEINRQRLKERRAKLLDELGAFDALTLRRMEREEIMKGVLRWLFGPSFELVPSTIQTLFEADDINPDTFVLNAQTESSEDWANVLQYGEFIKYIHNAIEWENVLYVMYPYFWDSPKNWPSKLFLDHPDPLHRIFLRAGAARVVLTIRPGFEKSFTSLMETGAFKGISATDHPYVTIVQEIQNFANTNYPGIPPANPDSNARPLLFLEQRRAWTDMQYLVQLLQAFKDDPINDNVYPTTAQGLASLKPYLKEVNDNNKLINQPTYTDIPIKDPWGNDYVYKTPGETGDYDLFSFGEDGKPGGNGKSEDISANAEGSLIATWFEYTPTNALDVSISSALADLA